VLVLEPEPQQAVLAFTSTQLGVSRKWLSMLRMARVQNNKGESVQAPMFANTYKLSTITQSNDKGSWNGYSINQEGPTELSVALMARDFMSAARSGDVKVKEEQQRDDAVNTPKDDIPF
jgi:formylmethanofuran dehydrogenase subunit E-like metal-binding protein